MEGIWEKVTFCLNGDNGVFLPKNPVINTMTIYDSAYEMLSAETVLPDLDDDFEGFLRGFEDYENFKYFCVNHEIVIVTVDNWDFVGAETLETVLPHIREYYEKEWCENEA